MTEVCGCNKNQISMVFFYANLPENIRRVEKHQAQEGAYSGKQCTLHCTWIDPPNPQQYLLYHLSEDTNYDHALLGVIFSDILRSSKFIMKLMINSDYDSQQYENKYVFVNIQSLADTKAKLFTHGASSHSEGLVDLILLLAPRIF